MREMKYCTHEPDVSAWWWTKTFYRPEWITHGKLCASCLKELTRGGRVLDTDAKVQKWWRDNTK